MAIDIKKIIAAINPDLYCDSSVKSEVKRILKENKGKKGANPILEAAKKAELKKSSYMDIDKVESYANPFKKEGIKNPIEFHTLSYDSFGESLEPVYFWLLDIVNKEYGETYKLIDNFISSPGSAHFSEMGQKATKMQDEAMKILGSVNTVIKSILNIIYDLKEFKIRLETYDDLKSADKGKRVAAFLSLKQIWMDTVDIKKGNSAIKAMAQQFEYVTLIDAFMAAESLESVTKKPEEGGLDLNERVRRILQQRFAEFERWLKESEKELRKRFEIEKIYLKSQYNSLKLYSRWLKPYLKAASDLEQRAAPTSALVNVFSTTIFELAFFGKGRYDHTVEVDKGDLPEMFRSYEGRRYYPIILVEFRFRSFPERFSSSYGFRGRVEATFSSYAMNDEEIEELKKAVEEDNFGEVYKSILGATEESLERLNEDLVLFEAKEQEKVEEDKSSSEEDINPFSALFSFFKKSKREGKKEKTGSEIAPDSPVETIIRNQCLVQARKSCKRIYDEFKRGHDMPAF